MIIMHHLHGMFLHSHKNDSFMLKSESNAQSYIYAKRQNYELVVETFHAAKPTVKTDAQKYLIQ